MEIYRDERLLGLIKKYKNDACATTKLSTDYERDFVEQIRKYYFKNDIDKVLVVSGLKGTGKTTGLLQAIEEFQDVLYITTGKNTNDTGVDYIKELENAPEKYIILDEFSWIKDREKLEYYLYTLVESGKKVAITGTDSLVLDYLNNGSLIHRVLYVNVNLFTYQEYCRLYQKEYSKSSSDEFIRGGSFFTEYAAENSVTMVKYIKDAVIDNLANLINIDEAKAKALIYDIMYLAVCPSSMGKVVYPGSRRADARYQAMLNRLGIDPLITLSVFDFKIACDILEKTGFIVRTYDLLNPDEDIFRLNLTNPSLTYQMIETVFDDISAEARKGYAYESYTVAYMSKYLRDSDELYYLNLGTGKPEIEIVICDNHDKCIYLMDAKESDKRRLPANKSIVSDDLEKEITKSTVLTIAGRYVISNSDFEEASEHNGKKVIFTQLERDTLLSYNMFDELYDLISSSERRYRNQRTNKKTDYNDDD